MTWPANKGLKVIKSAQSVRRFARKVEVHQPVNRASHCCGACRQPDHENKTELGTPGEKASNASRKAAPDLPDGRLFPIIGIGTSAGGLEALEHFLSHVPKGSGLAFVIVQHLDPTRKGIMAELLQRTTSMKVVQVRDRTLVQPNCVFVIPPNKDMSILHGVLHLLEPASPRGMRLPIDFFLRSLAQDQQEHSIGVILSGMGSDGTLGLRAIKEKGGVVLVQEPATAKFDGMPRSAIDSGLADNAWRQSDESHAGARYSPIRNALRCRTHPDRRWRTRHKAPGKSDHCCCAPIPAMIFPSTRKKHLLSPD